MNLRYSSICSNITMILQRNLNLQIAYYILLFLSLSYHAAFSCNSTKQSTEDIHNKKMINQKIEPFLLKNTNGVSVEILNYGGIISKIIIPDRNGNFKDIVLGFNRQDDYLEEHPYFGAVVGRFANRIAEGKFTLDGETYSLVQNNGSNHLHGGTTGFDKVFWDAESFENGNESGVVLKYVAKDMEEGYPGNLTVCVTYTLTQNNILKVAYSATTDKKTPINLTQHSYFNLSGDFSSQILDHELALNADEFLELNENQIPTGKYLEVANSPFDFRTPKPIGKDIDKNNTQLSIGKGYDHCWVLKNDNTLAKIAEVHHPKTGRVLEVLTSAPGVQLYTANFLNNTISAKTGGTYGSRSGFCLETQHFPDSPNQAHFPTTILEPGHTFTSETWFQFSIKDN